MVIKYPNGVEDIVNVVTGVTCTTIVVLKVASAAFFIFVPVALVTSISNGIGGCALGQPQCTLVAVAMDIMPVACGNCNGTSSTMLVRLKEI